jgi:hypothetical protein
MDVLGLTYAEYSDAERNAVVNAHLGPTSLRTVDDRVI